LMVVRCSQWIQHSMNIGTDLRVKYLCGMECELVHGMVELFRTLVLKCFSLLDFVIVSTS